VRLINYAKFFFLDLFDKKYITLERQNIESIQVSKTLSDQKLPYDDAKSPYPRFRKIYEANNVTLNPKTGVLHLDNKLITESSVWTSEKLRKWEPRPRYCEELSGKWVNLPDNGFYHFLIEDLPRFFDVEEHFFTSKILIGRNQKYILNLLDYLNLEYVVKDTPVKLERYFFSQKIIGGIPSLRDIENLISKFSSIKPAAVQEKIFVSRRNLNKNKEISRGLSEYPRITDLLARNGFHEIFLEDFELTQQISIIKGARVLAGIHGAGLSHLIWLNKKSKVIEISESRKTYHFEYLCNLKNLNYNRANISNLYNYL
jgi:hypothetical protein